MSSYHVINAIWIGVLPMLGVALVIGIACYILCCLNQIKNKCKEHRRNKQNKIARKKLYRQLKQPQKEASKATLGASNAANSATKTNGNKNNVNNNNNNNKGILSQGVPYTIRQKPVYAIGERDRRTKRMPPPPAPPPPPPQPSAPLLSPPPLFDSSLFADIYNSSSYNNPLSEIPYSTKETIINLTSSNNYNQNGNARGAFRHLESQPGQDVKCTPSRSSLSLNLNNAATTGGNSNKPTSWPNTASNEQSPFGATISQMPQTSHVELQQRRASNSKEEEIEQLIVEELKESPKSAYSKLQNLARLSMQRKQMELEQQQRAEEMRKAVAVTAMVMRAAEMRIVEEAALEQAASLSEEATPTTTNTPSKSHTSATTAASGDKLV
jgi:hypothetical protein